jgi:hypothetical protein
MMPQYQRELFVAMLRGLELIVTALRKMLEADKWLHVQEPLPKNTPVIYERNVSE